MNDMQMKEVFSVAVDRMLSGDKLTESEALSGEMSELLGLAGCLIENRYTPSNLSFQGDLEQSLLRQMRQRRENSVMNGIKSLFAPPRLRWKPILLTCLVVLMLGIGLLLLHPTVQAQIGQWLQWTGVREEKETPTWRAETSVPIEPSSLEKAQAQATFTILQPAYLPEGYLLSIVLAHNLHSGIADGPTIQLEYVRPGVASIVIEEFKARRKVEESVAPGYSQEVQVKGRPAIYIRGGWELDKTGKPTTWKEDSQDRLMFEMGDIVIWMFAQPPLGLEEMVRIAESL